MHEVVTRTAHLDVPTSTGEESMCCASISIRQVAKQRERLSVCHLASCFRTETELLTPLEVYVIYTCLPLTSIGLSSSSTPRSSSNQLSNSWQLRIVERVFPSPSKHGRGPQKRDNSVF